MMPEARRIIAKYMESLDGEERRVLEYFASNISVGEIVAIRDLRARYKIENPEEVIRRLIEKGLLERAEGCYNLAAKIREEIFSETR